MEDTLNYSGILPTLTLKLQPQRKPKGRHWHEVWNPKKRKTTVQIPAIITKPTLKEVKAMHGSHIRIGMPHASTEGQTQGFDMTASLFFENVFIVHRHIPSPLLLKTQTKNSVQNYFQCFLFFGK
ncbi:MAG: hypothetical protein GXO89_03685 [Chlorobi bacterium]|nr:hypothetical protein [Chlorobiota bacterium]